MQIFRLRDEAFHLVQDRSLPLRVRMHRLIDFGVRVQRKLLKKPAPSDVLPDSPALDTREALLQVMEALEPYDDSWPESVRLLADASLAVNLDEIDGGYENLLVYFLYRHFARGVLEGNLSARVKFCAVSVWFICLMNEVPAGYRRVHAVGPHHLHEGLLEAGRIQRRKHGGYAARPARGRRLLGGKPQAPFRVRQQKSGDRRPGRDPRSAFFRFSITSISA